MIKLIKTYGLLLVVLTALLICVNFIPKHTIKENLLESSETLAKEGVYKNYARQIIFKLDNFTDILMLNLVASVDNTKPIDATMKSYYNYAEPIANMPVFLRNTIEGNNLGLYPAVYARYWHGYQLFLRPLLTVFNYSQIRILNYILFATLITLCFLLIRRKISKTVAIIFLVSLLMMNFLIIPLSLQFSSVFYILLSSILAILYSSRLTESKENTLCTFFAIGALTSFFDLLTAPILTLGIPLIIYMLYREPKNKIKEVISLSLIWSLGYALMWVSKWCLCYFLTGHNIFQDAFTAVELRTSHSVHGGDVTIMDIIETFGLFVMPLFLILPIIYAIKKHSSALLKNHSYLLLIALMPPVWYFLLQNHSIQHIHFTWRPMLISLFSLLLFTYYTVDFKDLFKKIKK